MDHVVVGVKGIYADGYAFNVGWLWSLMINMLHPFIHVFVCYSWGIFCAWRLVSNGSLNNKLAAFGSDTARSGNCSLCGAFAEGVYSVVHAVKSYTIPVANDHCRI